MVVKVSVVTTRPFSACLQRFCVRSFRPFLCLRGKNSLHLSELSARKCQFPRIYYTVVSPYDITAASLTVCTVTACYPHCAFLGCCIAFTRPLPPSSRLQYGKSAPSVSIFAVFHRFFVLCYSVCFSSL